MHEFIIKEIDFFKNNIDNTFLILIITTTILLYVFSLFKGKVLWFALITLPATFFHELTHFIISLITGGMPRGFSVIPRKGENGGYVLGSVSSYNITWYNGFLVGLAPLLLLPIAYLGLKLLMVEEQSIVMLSVYSYLIANLIEGSIPSTTDFKLAFTASYPILIALIAVAAIISLR